MRKCLLRGLMGDHIIIAEEKIPSASGIKEVVKQVTCNDEIYYL